MYRQKLKRLRIVASGLLLCLLVMVMLISTIGTAMAQSTVDGDIINADHFYSPNMTRAWEAAGLQWVIYVDFVGANHNLYFKNSDDDGATWGNKTTITSSEQVHNVYYGCFYDSNNGYIHIAYSSTSGWLYYIRGQCNADGTITWSTITPELVIQPNQWLYSITVNTSGYAFIAIGSKILKNANLDGTWSTDWTKIFTHSGTAKLVPLANNKIAMIYRGSVGVNYRIYVQCWQGGDVDDWSSAVSNSKGAVGVFAISAVGQDDDIHIAFLEYSTNDIEYATYQYSTNSFVTQTQLYDGSTATAYPAIQRITDNNDLLVYWENDPVADHIYYAYYAATENTWDSYTDWVDESVIDGLPATSYYLGCQYTCTINHAGLFYIGGTAILKFDNVVFPSSVITLEANNITQTSAFLRGNILGVGTGSIIWRGFFWGQDPTLTTYTSIGEAGNFGTGVYSEPIDGLESDTLYYFKAVIYNSGNATFEGNITGCLTLQSSWAPPDGPDDPDIVPPLPPEPGGWIDNSKTYDSWPFSDLVNTFADNVSRSFVWFAIMVVSVCGIGLIVTGATKHLGITFLVMGVCLGLFIAGGYLDWWIMLPYLLVGIALITKEQQWGW